MRVLIDDGMQISVGTGIGKYSLYLYQTLRRHSDQIETADVARFDKHADTQMIGRLKYMLHINSPAYYRMTGKYDIVHYTNYAIPFIRNGRARYAVTIHDMASFLHPATFSKIYAVYSRFVSAYAARHADIIFTDSQAVRQEIVRQWPQYASKVIVAYPGYYTEFSDKGTDNGEDFAQKKDLQKRKFFLFTGTIEKRKNIADIIAAFFQLKNNSSAQDYKLVLAGRPGNGYDDFFAEVSASPFVKDVVFTGYISSAACQWLYQNAAAYIFPSIYEGFGSTQLECMANHLPLILSRIPTNEEVSKEYGLFFHLGDIDAMVMQMMKIVHNEYDWEEKNTAADRILRKFDWNNLIFDYIEAYQKGERGKT